jgi:DNA polymerase III subunit epsilon
VSFDWRATLGLPPRVSAMPLASSRWIAIDVETTGLDVHRDRLLAIGAIGIHGNAIDVKDSFEAVLRQDVASNAANILVHRISGADQRAGLEPAAALAEFLRFASGEQVAGCVGFHAAFDAAMIERAMRKFTPGARLRMNFLDLAELAPALLPNAVKPKAALDDWLEHFGLRIARRHDAVSDSLGTAQLFLCLLAAARAGGIRDSGQLFKLARAQRWLARA